MDMLGVMKNIFSPDAWKSQREAIDYDRERLDRLQIGSAVEFGFMPQLALSAKRFKVTGVRTYAFDGDKFVSYALDHGLDHHVNMIVAEAEGEKYLSISRHITAEEAQKLFSAENFDEVMEKFAGDRIQCREGVVGFLGWTATSYRKVMEHVNGSVCEGDFRETTLETESGPVSDFQYALFVSDTDEFAIEIERHLDDRVELYATVYRRATDIARVFPPMKLFSPAVVETPKPKIELNVPPLSVQNPVQNVVNIREVEPEVEVVVPSTEVVHAITVDTPPQPRAIPVIRPEPKAKAKFEPETTAKNDLEIKERQMLECDMRLAGKIIEEAIQNKMTLSDLVRKVLDLPVELAESVHIPVSLSDADVKTLAARYKISATDKEGIRHSIVRELASFAGGKSK